MDSPLTYDQAHTVLSEAIFDLKNLIKSGRIRDPERDRVRVESYRTLIDLCMDYCYMQIYSEILELRTELNEIVRKEAA